jgi:hypothetical protein
MPTIVDYLGRLNRKERYHLVSFASGGTGFRLCERFRTTLLVATGLTVPEDAFVAMDYHLNWIYASCILGSDDRTDLVRDNPLVHWRTDDLRIVQGNQQDVDLIVAFNEGKKTHLILIEAKGVLSFTNDELRSKAVRLAAIFGDSGGSLRNVEPHFVIVSPKEPKRLVVTDWPEWMRRFKWAKLPIEGAFLKVTRCDKVGIPDADGVFWTTKPEVHG